VFLDILQELVHLEGYSLVEIHQIQLGLEPCPYPTKSKLAHGKLRGCVITCAAFQRSAVDIVATQLADCHSSILMGVHLDKGKTSIGLETSLDHVSKVLEERNKVVLGGVGSEVTNIAGGLPSWGLLNNHVVALHAVGREVVMAKGGGWSHSHCGHGLLLRDGWLALLVSPVAADCSRTKPFTIHRAQRLLGILTLTESNETVSSRSASLHVPHNSGFRDGAKSRESLKENFIIDFV
jgi:hypothetical protein